MAPSGRAGLARSCKKVQPEEVLKGCSSRQQKQSTLDFPVKLRSRSVSAIKKLPKLKAENNESPAKTQTIKSAPVTPCKTPVKTPKRRLFDENTNGSPSKKNCSPSKEKSSKTPASLLRQLDLEDSKSLNFSPISTPKSPLKPKCLFETTGSAYSAARQALHSSQPTSLPCRERELETLQDFLVSRLEDRDTDGSGSLYISGAPGTGKTASVNYTLQHNKIKQGFKFAFLNCTSMSNSRTIFTRVAEQLQVKIQGGGSEKDCTASIVRHITKSNKKLLLVLDEIDQLESRHQAVLYTIFEWPALAGSQLTLIGIANSLDLTDRLLPRLHAHIECRPRLMHFAPYTKQQISQIISHRLQEVGAAHVFKGVAVEMLAAKVAAVSGDARRALDIGRRVVEIIDDGSDSGVLKQISDHNNTPQKRTPRKASPTKGVPVAPCVGLLEVKQVLDGVYGTSQSLQGATSDGGGLPLQQKLLICSLLLMLKKGATKDVTIAKLHEVYGRVCTKRNLNSVPQSEFYSMCGLVEARGILSIAHAKKEARLSKVSLQWDEEEVSAALCDRYLLSAILGDVSCLSARR